MQENHDVIEFMIRFLPCVYAEEGPERVGFIVDNRIIEVQNISDTPETGWLISPEDAVAYAEIAFGTWHTHPGDEANLGGCDFQTFKEWPDLYHFVVGKDGVRCFKFDSTLNAVMEVNGKLQS